MSQTTIINPNTVGGMCAQTSPSSTDEEYYVILSGDDSASKQINPTADNGQDGPLKASFKKALTKTSNLLGRIFTLKNAEKATTFYEEKGNDVGAACKKAGRSVYKRAPLPRRSATDLRSTADTTAAAGRKCSTKSWFARKAKVAVCTAVNAVRFGVATAKLGLDATLGVFEAAGAAALYALDQFDEEE